MEKFVSCDKQSQQCSRQISSDVNTEDLTFKAKNLTFKAKAKDLTFKGESRPRPRT